MLPIFQRSKYEKIGIFREMAMIEFKTGDILADDAEALVNTVNCVGIMGRGVALQFKNAFPSNYDAYEKACERQDVQPGRMFVFENKKLTNPRYIINFPTKRHWRGKSRIEDIEAGLRSLVTEIKSKCIRSVAIPPLGSGLGGLDWMEVRPRIVNALREVADVKVTVYEPMRPSETPDAAIAGSAPKMTLGRAALIGLMDRYLSGLLDPFVTLLEVHKLMYFMQESGENLKLQYVQAPYGPYAENLRHVLKKVEGYFISGYADGGDAPDKQLELVPGAVSDAKELLENNDEARLRFDRVATLVDGFETPFGLELLSTVHWVVTRLHAQNVSEVLTKTYAWNERKRRFTHDQIELALKVLAGEGWINFELPTPQSMRTVKC
jgi:O-acetyl-ADP-ribose deacetylase (regulator of RNase III)